MIDSAAMKASLLQYVERFNAGDAEGIAALYAEDATVEDPVGAKVIAGRAAILAFYQYAVSGGARLEVVAPPRGSHGDAATLSFAVHARLEGRAARIDVTDVMTFDADGRFRSMRAYWAPDDIHFA
jgi:steroid delta-isomerase